MKPTENALSAHANHELQQEKTTVRTQDSPVKSDDLQALDLQKHRPRLRRLVELRLDNRVRARVDASDVIQDTQLEAIERVDEFLSQAQEKRVPVFVWLRFLALQKVAQIHRRHLGTQARDAGREISLFQGPMHPATSAALAAQLVGKLTSASQAALRAEAKAKVQTALDAMREMDRAVLTLLHFEQLTHKEAAAVLGIGEKALGGRHVRALAKLKKLL